jgi:hypothetical protein
MTSWAFARDSRAAAYKVDESMFRKERVQHKWYKE